jgi:stage II sporulation protein D
MISKEPVINVGILDHVQEVRGIFHGRFQVQGITCTESFSVHVENRNLVLQNAQGKTIVSADSIGCGPVDDVTFTLHDVTIGRQFHWERKEHQTFRGALKLILRDAGTIAVVNVVSVEEYLASVISSEMSTEAPMELLKAHAITSRSWLVAMLEREQKNVGVPSQRSIQQEHELTRWYDREDHDLYDVCADDHCQRYQGITKILSPNAVEAVDATWGTFLVFGNEICDARFSKACGGLSEEFEFAWENKHVPYLASISDSSARHARIHTEPEASAWIRSRPDAYCNTTDQAILRQILPSFDQETTDFFRWKVEYTREELEEIVRTKSWIDFGTLKNLVPLQRGPSGRIHRLKIEGSIKTIIVGKELEIRRWLSKSHLYSSAFIVETERDTHGIPKRFILHGAGWGHGVGLCQIGAAVMAAKRFKAEEIVKHYFRGAELQKLY